MDTSYMLVFGLVSIALCGVTWGICHWRYGRRIAEALLRLDKSEKARQFSSHQLTQARKQIEKLQKDLAAAHQRAASTAPRSEQLEEVLRQGDAEAARAQAGRPPGLPPNGFADTEPMERGG